MSELQGTKTHKNLQAAFAGEAQANRRYLYFVTHADIEGYPDVASLSRDAAEGETGHAHGQAAVALLSCQEGPRVTKP